jgi:hypothetical protein
MAAMPGVRSDVSIQPEPFREKLADEASERWRGLRGLSLQI